MAVLQAEHRHARRRLREERRCLRLAKRGHADALEARALLQAVAEAVQQQCHRKVAAVVNRCLEAVFENPYTFRIDFKQARGKTEATLILERDGLELDDPLNEAGGSVVDVAAFALRLAGIVLKGLRRFVVLDEPFLSVDNRGNRARLVGLLEVLCEELHFQLLIVTHDKDFMVGEVVELE